MNLIARRLEVRAENDNGLVEAAAQLGNIIIGTLILAYVGFSVKFRMMRNVSLHTAAAPSVHLNGTIAPQKEICWRLSRCVYSFVPICAMLGSSSGRITSRWFGYLGLRIPKV